jgi:glycosyltransferase involved in cell wall biosynthesis
MTAEPLVSVVTPFYNTAAYLAEAIESVLAQTYQTWELVLVDNQSTDASPEIAARYAARDPRIKVVRNREFLGQVQNYNEAMRQIAPAAVYVKMVQADDAIFPRCLTEMVAMAEANPSVAIISSYRMFGRRVQPSGLAHTSTFMTGRDAARVVLLDDLYMFGSPTTLMFRADAVRSREPFWEEGRLFEDADVCYELLAEHDFAFVHQVLTFTRLDNDSLWGGMKGYDPVLLSRRIQLATYGRQFLAPDEFEACWHAHDAEYRRFLAEAWLRRREPGFWDFHRKGLATIGETIERGALVRDAVPIALHYAFSPATIGAALLRRARRRLERD